MNDTNKFLEGARTESTMANFIDGLRAAVDYRGDCTLELKDGSSVEGFLYNLDIQTVDLFPKNSPRAMSVKISDVKTLIFTGEDTASGKGWEDWMKKKETERAALKAQSVEASV